MEGADESTELWRHPYLVSVLYVNSIPNGANLLKGNQVDPFLKFRSTKDAFMYKFNTSLGPGSFQLKLKVCIKLACLTVLYKPLMYWLIIGRELLCVQIYLNLFH